MKKYNKKASTYTIRGIDSVKFFFKVFCFYTISLAALTPVLLHYEEKGKLLFLWGLVIFGIILNIVHFFILGNRRKTILLDINSGGITLLCKFKELHFEWDEIDYIHLRLGEDIYLKDKIQAFFYLKPIYGPEVGVPLGFFMENPSLHARRIKRVVLEHTGRSDLVINDYPPYWELVIMPWRVEKRYKKQKEEKGKCI